MAKQTWSKSRYNKSASRRRAKEKLLPMRTGDNTPLTKEQRQGLNQRKYKSKYVRKYGMNISEIAKKTGMSVGHISKLPHKAIIILLKGVK